MPDSTSEKTVFETKWFRVVTKQLPNSAEPHYLIHTNDFVSIVAVDVEGKLLLVRQFRPSIEDVSLEVPSGHIEAGETPEQAARKELLEETGHVADKFDLLGTVCPSIGRYTNRLWCYFAAKAKPSDDPSDTIEAGLNLVRYGGTLQSLVKEKEFVSSLSYTSLLMAMVDGRLSELAGK